LGRQSAVLIRADVQIILVGNRSDLYPESAIDRKFLKSARKFDAFSSYFNNND
jgi:GTPase SAR1 family protein